MVIYGQAAVAQSVERPTTKQKIVGSSPSQSSQGKMLRVHHNYVRMSYTCRYRLVKSTIRFVNTANMHIIFVTNETIETQIIRLICVLVKRFKDVF